MEFKKVTISLPKKLYDEGMKMVEKGFFSNFSDLIRSGIREEFKEMRRISIDFDERNIYRDDKLIAGVKESISESKSGEGKILKNEKEMDEYFEKL